MSTIEIFAPHIIICNPMESARFAVALPQGLPKAVAIFIVDQSLFPLCCPNGFVTLDSQNIELTLSNFSLPYILTRPKSSMEMMAGDRNRIVVNAGEKLGNLVVLK